MFEIFLFEHYYLCENLLLFYGYKQILLLLVGEDGTVSSTILDSQLSLLSIHGSPIIPEGHVIHTDGQIMHPLEGHMIPHLIPRPIPDPRIMPPNENEMLPLPDSAIVSPSNGHATGDVFLRQEAGPETNQSVAVMIEPNTLNLLGPIGVQVGKSEFQSLTF